MNNDDISYVEAHARYRDVPISAIWMMETETDIIVLAGGETHVIHSLSSEFYDTSTYLELPS